MMVDLEALRAELARSVRAAVLRRENVAVNPFVSKGLDPVIGEWAKSLIASGELDARSPRLRSRISTLARESHAHRPLRPSATSSKCP